MSQESRFREIVVRVVGEVFDAKARTLRDELIHQVLHEAEPLLAAAHRKVIEQLDAVTAMMHQAQNQNEILLAMLEGVAYFTGRAALLVARGASAIGWQARGCAQNDAIRSVALDLSSGLARHAVERRGCVTGPLGEAETRLRAVWGTMEAECAVVPLIIRDRVVALIYADAASEPGRQSDPALQLLARAAGSCLELTAVRQVARSAAAPNRTEPAAAASETPATVGAVPWAQTVSAQASTAMAAPSAAPSSSVASDNGGGGVAQMQPPEPATIGSAAASLDSEEELHRKARRFAKLLVDEIKLYNHAKVLEGKRNRDLYDRLKDDIDKSRATYDKRYSQTSVADANYFARELVRNLADNNETLLGASFPR